MGSRDHSIECEGCGCQRGGMDDLVCRCDLAAIEERAFQRLSEAVGPAQKLYGGWRWTLAANLAIAGGLCRAYQDGWWAGRKHGEPEREPFWDSLTESY